jgi:acetoin utilization deacetylase AcuC-like enzyme
MPVVWSDRCRLHDPGGEIFVGVRAPGTEVVARADVILAALAEAGARVVDAEQHSDVALHAVHDAALLEFLESAWQMDRCGARSRGHQDRVVPYVFAHEALTSGRPAAVPTAVWARTGYFAYDTMTLIGPGTWDAARAAVDSALTAVDLVAAGAPCAYACCRPPGHHVCRACYGGSCYLNNSAVAAAALADRLGGPVVVLDIDAHHGNGTRRSSTSAATCSSVPFTSTRARAGFHTSSASPTKPAAATARVRTGISRCRLVRATSPGSMR